MLVLTDRGFDAAAFLEAVAATRARFLARLTSTRKLRSWPAWMTARSCPGSASSPSVHRGGGHRHARGRHPLLRPLPAGHHPAEPPPLPGTRADPPVSRKMEHEVAYLALRHTLLNGRVLRSQARRAGTGNLGAAGPLPALRREITAVETVPGTDPDRASFTTALEPRETLTAASGVVSTGTSLTGRIGRAVLDDLLPPRRPRQPARSNPRCPAQATPTPPHHLPNSLTTPPTPTTPPPYYLRG